MYGSSCYGGGCAGSSAPAAYASSALSAAPMGGLEYKCAADYPASPAYASNAATAGTYNTSAAASHTYSLGAPQSYSTNNAAGYQQGASGTGNYQFNDKAYLTPSAQHNASFTAEEFLDPHRPAQPFVGNAKEIQPFVEEAFRSLVGTELPRDIIVRLGSEEQLAKAYPGNWDHNIAGFALNRVGWGTSEIFIRKDELDKVLLTVGHELGHVMSPSLPSVHNEEAKAFAFSIAWMKTVRDNNIAGIGHFVNPNPARNGLHDIAFNFVADLVEKGAKALDLFVAFANNVISVR